MCVIEREKRGESGLGGGERQLKEDVNKGFIMKMEQFTNDILSNFKL